MCLWQPLALSLLPLEAVELQRDKQRDKLSVSQYPLHQHSSQHGLGGEMSVTSQWEHSHTSAKCGDLDGLSVPSLDVWIICTLFEGFKLTLCPFNY